MFLRDFGYATAFGLERCFLPALNLLNLPLLLSLCYAGAYKLSGPEWDSISPDAKDLVRKMLDINPDTRINTYDILTHPWIKKAGDFDSSLGAGVSETGAPEGETATPSAELFAGLHGKSSVVHGHLLRGSLVDAVVTTETDSTASMSTSPVTPHTMAAGKHSDVHLSRALDHLAGHIKVLKTEKLAKQVTRLMIAKATSGSSKLAALFLHRMPPPHATASQPSPNGGWAIGFSPAPTPRPPSTRGLTTPAMAPILEEDESILRMGSEIEPDNAPSLPVTLSDAELASLGDFSANINAFSTRSSPHGSTTTLGTGVHSKFDELLQMVNSEAKEAVTAALFAYFGADAQSRLTMAQFILLLKRFGMLGADTSISGTDHATSALSSLAPSAVPSECPSPTTPATPATPATTSSSVSTLTVPSLALPPHIARAAHSNSSVMASVALSGPMMAKFADRESKGYITPEDFFTAQVGPPLSVFAVVRCVFYGRSDTFWTFKNSHFYRRFRTWRGCDFCRAFHSQPMSRVRQVLKFAKKPLFFMSQDCLSGRKRRPLRRGCLYGADVVEVVLVNACRHHLRHDAVHMRCFTAHIVLTSVFLNVRTALGPDPAEQRAVPARPVLPVPTQRVVRRAFREHQVCAGRAGPVLASPR
jgi:serine/threonine protein kinase